MVHRQTDAAIMLKNGRVIQRTSVTIDVTSPALRFGQSLFETMLVRDQPALGSIFLVEEHVKRLIRSAHRLGWAGLPDEMTLLRWVIRAADLFGRRNMGLGRLRLTAAWTRKDGRPDVYVTVVSYVVPQDSATAAVTPVTLPWSDLAGAHKSGSRHVYHVAEQFAQAKNVDEALLVDDRGRPAEGARSNLFLVENGEIWTYPVKNGVLPGITRMAVLQLASPLRLQPKERPFTTRSLADGVVRGDVFLTNALWGVRAVAAIDGHRSSGISPVVEKIREAYQKAVAVGCLPPGKPLS